MFRARFLVPAIATAAFAASFSLSACARDSQPPATATPAATSEPARLAQVRPASAAIGPWRLGTHYKELNPPVATNVGSGKIEVIEIFWYSCPHCYHLEPVLESWLKNKPASVEFSRMHVTWTPQHKQQAHLHYALQALGKPELHAKAFQHIQAGNYLVGRNDKEARDAQLAWAKSQGVSEADFNKAYDSMSVAMKLSRSEAGMKNYRVESVPTIVINGRYVTDVQLAGGNEQLIKLINDLAASEQRR